MSTTTDENTTGPEVRKTRVQNGIETSEVDVAETVEKLDGERALVRIRDGSFKGGQELPATLRAYPHTVENNLVIVDYDRHGRDVVPLGWVARLFDAMEVVGVDQTGATHLYDPATNRVTVDTGGEIEFALCFDEHDHEDIRSWAHFIADDRGWNRGDD